MTENWLRKIQLGEDSGLELKRLVWRGAEKIAEPHPDGLSDELAAMANAQGGVLILGVDDKTKEIQGIPPERLDAAEQWITALCNERINPPLDVHTRHCELPDQAGSLRPVIIVTVPKSLWVHQSANGYFRRVGHAKRPLPPDALARLFQQRSQARIIRFEEQAVAGSSAEDIDALLIRPLLVEGQGDMELQLRRLHLLTDLEGSSRLTVAGALLCTLKPTRWLPSAYIQAVSYAGVDNDPDEQLDAKDFDGPIDRQIWDALDFVRLHMKTPARKTLGRVDYPQYSLKAVFEALVNAVAHRDYSIWGGRIRLHLFADRLELYSPGSLPNTMSIESMAAMSMPRNEIIASLFSRYYPLRDEGLGRTCLMDRRGAGVDVILRESEKLSGKRPLYETFDDIELRLTLWAAAPPES